MAAPIPRAYTQDNLFEAIVEKGRLSLSLRCLLASDPQQLFIHPVQLHMPDHYP